MRKKLFVFFMLILFFGVTITGYVSYDFMKNWIVESTKKSLKSESMLIKEYAKSTSNGLNFDKLAKKIKQVIDRRITIIDLKGTVLGESDMSKEILQNHLYRPEVQQSINEGEGSALRYSDSEHFPMYYYAVKTNINGNEYIVRLAVKLTAIEEMQESYLKFVIIAILVGILISGLLAAVLLNIFVKPINALIKMASSMSLGNYDKRMINHSKDEIGELGNAFNTLADRLELTISDLADKQNKLKSILTSMDDGVIVLDKYEKIILINPAAQKFFNINGDATGKYLIEAVRNHEFEIIAQTKPDKDVEVSFNGTSPKRFRVRTTRVINTIVKEEKPGDNRFSMHDNDADNELMLMVIQDITKIKALEEMRSDFVANVSHELKTPLTSIKGFAETLKMVEDQETKDKFLDIINVEAERLTRLINDILTLSEIESRGFRPNMSRIQVKSIINDIYDIMEPVARSKDIELSYQCENEEELFVSGDKDKYKQMLINLVDNAIKYTNDNGAVKVLATKSGDKVVIQVEDNGIGIPKEHINRLFERFYRVDKARSRSMGGTGLGLAIVKHILILFNGSIEVKSEVGTGTIFIVTLPLS